ncbi:MAG: hypothetical protein QY322_03195 [bacterium]|nr:MAG: hypothetical protein QY322_03195 [bacterium]
MFETSTFTSIQNNAGLPAWNVLLEPAGFIELALPYIFGVAGIILLFNIVTSGFKMMTSQGDPKVMQVAQAKLTTSAIGILILFTSFWIVKLVMQFLGIDLTLFG